MAQPLTLQILERLIGFDTTSCNSNLALMEYVQNFLQEHGVSSQLVYDEDENKANLYATIGPEDKAGIMLSGHTDTVPVAGQNWTKQAHQLSEQDGRYYGRGTSDMKGFLAVVLAYVPQMVNRKLHTPIHLAFSYDEEIGCVGVRRLIHTMKNHRIKPAACIIGEPTSMKVVTAHKGKFAARVTVRGKECHSGMAPQGVNAINYASRLIVWLEELAKIKQQVGPFDHSYDIPHSTVHTGTIEGGSALNIVPNYCSFLFEIRNIAGDDPWLIFNNFKLQVDKLEAEMKKIDDGCKIEITITTEYPGLDTAEHTDVVKFVRYLAKSAESANINFGTEGGLFSNELKIPTVVCGPGSMEQGHKPDEFIHVSQLEFCEEFMTCLCDELSG